jgi:hypothetical protein
MALHRDIYWVGKQWAVTGHGIQACDQKQKGKFDIEASRIWEDGVLDEVRAQKWINIKDFDKAVEAAREHYPEPERTTARAAPPESTVPAEPPRRPAPAAAKAPPAKSGGAVAPPKMTTPNFEMRIKGWPAKFQPMWRIRIGR